MWPGPKAKFSRRKGGEEEESSQGPTKGSQPVPFLFATPEVSELGPCSPNAQSCRHLGCAGLHQEWASVLKWDHTVSLM